MSDKEMLHKLADDMTESQCSEVIEFIVSEIASRECDSCKVDDGNLQLRSCSDCTYFEDCVKRNPNGCDAYRPTLFEHERYISEE